MSTVNPLDHVSFVHSCVRNSKVAKWASVGACTQYDDLVQEGMLGLFKAAERYKPEHGVKFLTYAQYWINAYITSYCFDQMRTVRVPRNAATKAWREGKSHPRTALSIDTGFATDDENTGFSVLDMLGFVQDPASDEQKDVEDMNARLRQAMRALPERVRETLVARFWREEKLQQVGDRYDVSRERARQMEAEGISRLKRRFGVEA